jgi:hypothetical protein
VSKNGEYDEIVELRLEGLLYTKVNPRPFLHLVRDTVPIQSSGFSAKN